MMLLRRIFVSLCLCVASSLASAQWLPISQLGLNRLPAVELKNLASENVDLSPYKGKIVVVNFWASWCEPCVQEFQTLLKLQNQYKDQGLVVVAVNLGESRPRIYEFLQSNEIPQSAMVILRDHSSLTYKSWKARGIPTTYLIDQSGAALGYWSGSFMSDLGAFTDRITSVIPPQ